jgi:hypothetical protein
LLKTGEQSVLLDICLCGKFARRSVIWAGST